MLGFFLPVYMDGIPVGDVGCLFKFDDGGDMSGTIDELLFIHLFFHLYRDEQQLR